MTVITIDSPEWQTCTLTCGLPINYQQGLITSLVSNTLLMHATVPLVKVTVTATAIPFDYKIEAVDGRIWRQKIYERVANPPMTFVHADQWRMSESLLQVPMRSDIVWLLTQFDLQSVLLKPA